MAQQNRTTLKSYFETGDTLTENNFIDLIDSFFNFSEGDTISNINIETSTYELIHPSNSTNGQDGNWRLRVNSTGYLVTERRESGSWVEWERIGV